MDEIKKEYTKLKKQYKNLPDFKKLDEIFEVSTLETELFLLRNIRRRILEKLTVYIKLLEQLIQPDNNFIELSECKVFTEEEKDTLMTLLRKLMTCDRKALLLDLSTEDKDHAKYITEVYGMWNDMHKQMTGIISKITDAWETKKISKESVEYLG